MRAYARDLGVVLAAVPATGAALTRADVDAAARGEASTDAAHTVEVAAAPASVAFASTNTNPTERRTPIRGVRKHTAEAMVRSAFTAPHVTTFHTVDVTASLELVAALREDRALAEHRIGLTAIIAKAVCLALRHHPTLNSSWDERAGEIVEYAHVALGIAAATERGLVVPTIPHADTLTLPALADAVAALTETARSGRTAPERLRDGTFTISNIGVFGVEAGTPILNPGEAGILAVGAVVRRPWEHDGQIALRDVMTLSLSFDHRLVDGEQGARFLVEVARLLEQPARALVLS